MAKITQLASAVSVKIEFNENELDILESIFSCDMKEFVDRADASKKAEVQTVINDMRSSLSRAKSKRNDARRVLSGEMKAVVNIPVA